MCVKKKSLDVVVIGSAGVDTNVYLYGEDIDFSVEANFSQNIDYVGQAGGFYAKLFARLGNNVGYIGFVGSDVLGNFVLKDFHDLEIDTTHVGIDPLGTKRSVNLMYKNGQRKNFYDGKGHMDLSVEWDKIKTYFEGVKLVHINLMNWSRFLLPYVKMLNIPISCDLQDIVKVDDPYRKEFMELSDYLFFSCVNFTDPQPVLDHVFTVNPNVKVLIGRGKDGCIFATKGHQTEYSAVEIENWPIIDTNGAGDSLGVGFIISYLFDHYSLDDSILRGQIMARYTCGLKANTSNLLTKNSLDTIFAQKKND
ncbi:MAG: carbohydrate kinase family protein [Promethearchaeota archaeon]